MADTVTGSRAIQNALAKPFDAKDVKLKPQMVKANRALAISYVDARAVMDRLDSVMGIDCWRDEYTVLPSGEVECRLSLKFGDEWVTKADVGGQSEQPDDGDKLKAAFSDALKRAAVKFGIGRYLYRMGGMWMDYDPVKKQIVRGNQPTTSTEPAAYTVTTATTEPGQVSEWALDIINRLANLDTREKAMPLWNTFELKVNNRTISRADKAAIDKAFADFGTRLAKARGA